MESTQFYGDPFSPAHESIDIDLLYVPPFLSFHPELMLT